MTAKPLPAAGQEHQCCDHRRADGVVPCPDCGAAVNRSGEPITLEDQARISFHSNKCPACNRRKKVEESFCKPCYYSLPSPFRTFLYKTFLQGYARHWKDALDWLNDIKAKKAGKA